MTATLNPVTPAQSALIARLEGLRADRDAALSETAVTGSGDAADRATNVDAHVRLAVLEERIADVEAELYRLSRAGGDDLASDTVHVGSTVTVDFGDGPETYAVTSVDLAPLGAEVITPGSPLGRALVGATAGSTIEYRTAAGRTASVTVVAVG